MSVVVTFLTVRDPRIAKFLTSHPVGCPAVPILVATPGQHFGGVMEEIDGAVHTILSWPMVPGAHRRV